MTGGKTMSPIAYECLGSPNPCSSDARVRIQSH